MTKYQLDNPPVFFIGMPRSGTTIIFERFVENKSLGWLSNYSEMFPGYPSVNLLCPLLSNNIIDIQGRKKQYGSVRFGNRYMPQAVEAYAFWNMYARHDFSRDYLLGLTATEEEKQNVRAAVYKTINYQRKSFFSTKITGPGRLSYIQSIFPDARFIHVIRDGRAVVNSLLKVDFWEQKGGFEAPFWQGGLTEDDLKPWHENSHPAILTAIQWRKVIDSIRQEKEVLAPDSYIEIRYEDFIRSSEECINQLYNFTGIENKAGDTNDNRGETEMRDMNKKYLDDLDEVTRNNIDELLRVSLMDSGYDV